MGLRLLVGLGNPGPRYRGTRHNLGFEWIERLAVGDGSPWREFRGLGEVAKGVSRPGVLYARPLTFMNLSGRLVSALAQKHGFLPCEMLVGFDDMSLPLGRLRLRQTGSSGGHNGLQSVLESLGTRDVPRLRMGIGAAPAGVAPAEYVLSRFKPEEKSAALEMLERAATAAEAALESGLETAMNRFNAA